MAHHTLSLPSLGGLCLCGFFSWQLLYWIKRNSHYFFSVSKIHLSLTFIKIILLYKTEIRNTVFLFKQIPKKDSASLRQNSWKIWERQLNSLWFRWLISLRPLLYIKPSITSPLFPPSPKPSHLLPDCSRVEISGVWYTADNLRVHKPYLSDYPTPPRTIWMHGCME
jgi:hypothetical protein